MSCHTTAGFGAAGAGGGVGAAGFESDGAATGGAVGACGGSVAAGAGDGGAGSDPPHAIKTKGTEKIRLFFMSTV